MSDAARPLALVTGATRGIGLAIADALACAGVRVVVHGREDLAAAQRAAAALPGADHHALCADLARPGSARELFDATVRACGVPGIVVLNAGVNRQHPPLESDWSRWDEAWSQILAVNLRSAADLLYLAARCMAERRSGRIVAVASRGAFRGEPEAPAYGASKAGLVSLCQSAAKALAPHGIFVASVAPGFVETDLTRERLAGAAGRALLAECPLGRLGTAQEVAEAVRYLALDAPPLATGSVLDLNGASYLRL